MINQIAENNFINSLIKNFPRSRLQINNVHESDAEIIETAENSQDYLAITTDSIVEEIKTGLYDDPYLIGWMSVMVNLSDLAAVGSKPLGILVSEILPSNFSSKDLEKLQTGISDACKMCNTFIFGGDTNNGDNLIVTGTAIGILENKKFVSRIGLQENDILYSTGLLGKGNAFAIFKFFNSMNKIFEYQPIAKINEGRIIKDFASACMDTSDGVLSTLDQLMRLNNKGFKLDDDWENKIDKDSLKLANSSSIHPWLLLAGYHGEFELLFTIPQKLESEFLMKAKGINWIPIKLGVVIKDPKLKIPIYGKLVEIDSTKIRNLSSNLENGIDLYLKSLLTIDKEMRSN
jgi:thiamine-monophosphate kinase